MSSVVAFWVHGIPAPQGSKRHVGNGVMVESSRRVKPWRESVKWAAIEDHAKSCGAPSIHFPKGVTVRVDVTFYLPRPAGHYRTGKNSTLLRDAAPAFPAGRPDLDKLTRSTLDAIGEANLWSDDSQVVDLTASKRYPEHPLGRVGAFISITKMPGRIEVGAA